ncbi:MAG: ABC transporter ATP-binding protein [Candidatus Omnitrophica bacterium]|nr:ABC transporter ATP-binding protein [Candidatus Omnitrophota bacterium]
MLKVENLIIESNSSTIVDNISFEINGNEIVAFVGASGSGKTMTSLGIMNILPAGLKITSGTILFKNEYILKMNKERLRSIRGKEISMVFQEPATALNPVMNIEEQIKEIISAHEKFNNKYLNARVDEVLAIVKLPEYIKKYYPHEISGGMKQRVMLAIAMACNPELLILDEPTTALDVELQKDILDTVKELQKQQGFSVIFISHDFSVVNLVADRIYVMNEGKIVEEGTKEKVLFSPKDEYTKLLIKSIPRLGDTRERLIC